MLAAQAGCRPAAGLSVASTSGRSLTVLAPPVALASSRSSPASTLRQQGDTSSTATRHQQTLRPRSRVLARYQTALTPAKVVDKPPEEELLLPLPRNTENAADDVTLHNPLQRSERLSTGWFGVIMEYDGVVVQDTHHLNVEAWLKVATEFNQPRPLGQTMNRIKGVRDDLVVRTIFRWTQNPSVSTQIAKRKAEVYDELVGENHPVGVPEALPFLETLRRYNVPIALATWHPEAKVLSGLQKLSLRHYFDAIITAEDSGAAEVEFSYLVAAQKIQRPPVRCIVVGESNKSVEAAHEVGMKCVVVTGNKPVYDFVGADLVVKSLNQLSFINMKRLFGNEDLVESKLSPEELQELQEQANAGSSRRDSLSSSSSGYRPFDFDGDFEDEDEFEDDFEDELEDGPGGRRGAADLFADRRVGGGGLLRESDIFRRTPAR